MIIKYHNDACVFVDTSLINVIEESEWYSHIAGFTVNLVFDYHP